MNQTTNQAVSLTILIIVIIFGAYAFYIRNQLKNINTPKITQEMCEEYTNHCKNLKELTLFEKDIKELKRMEITVVRDALDKLEWKATVTLVDRKGFETNNSLKEYEFFTLVKKIESLVYKGGVK